MTLSHLHVLTCRWFLVWCLLPCHLLSQSPPPLAGLDVFLYWAPHWNECWPKDSKKWSKIIFHLNSRVQNVLEWQMILLKKCRSSHKNIYTCKSMYAVVLVSYTWAGHFGATCTCKHSLIYFVIGIIPQNLLDDCFYCWSIGSQIDCHLADWQIFSNKNIIWLSVNC